MAIKMLVKNGRKLFDVYINGKDKSGKRIQMRKRSLQSMRKAEEAEFELKRKLAILKESEVDPRWNEWITEALGIMKVLYKPSTLYSYQKTLDKWIPESWKDKELKSFTKGDIHSFIYEEMQDTTQHTRKFVLKIIKRIFQLAIEHGKLEKNPCNGLQVKVPEGIKKVLTNQEAEILLTQGLITNHRFYPVWVAALFTGMRSGELYALKWSDVDLDAKLINVSRSWNSKNGFTPTKNQKTRVVPVSDKFHSFLLELKLKAKKEFVLPRLAEWERGGAAKVTKKFCKSIGITEIKFHDLRATFITNLLSRGVPMAQVMSVVGHADLETTNVYLRMAGVEVKNSTESLGYEIPALQVASILQFPGVK